MHASSVSTPTRASVACSPSLHCQQRTFQRPSFARSHSKKRFFLLHSRRQRRHQPLCQVWSLRRSQPRIRQHRPQRRRFMELPHQCILPTTSLRLFFSRHAPLSPHDGLHHRPQRSHLRRHLHRRLQPLPRQCRPHGTRPRCKNGLLR